MSSVPEKSRARRRLRVVVTVVGLAAAGVCLWVWYERRPDGMGHVRANPKVQASGDLKLLGTIELADYPTSESDVVARVLQAAAPVSTLFEHLVPPELIAQVPPEGPSTPEPPPPPRELGPLQHGDLDFEACSWVAGGQLAARVWNKSRDNGPCFLVIAYGERGSAHTFQYELMPRMDLSGSRLVIYGEGEGLLAIVHWYVTNDETGAPERRSAIYRARPPDWQPRRLAVSEQLGPTFRVAGQTTDANSLYISSRLHPDNEKSIWKLDSQTGSLYRVYRGAAIRGYFALIPSPDGALLATYNAPLLGSGTTQRPLEVVDCREGTVEAVTWRDKGSYIDSALAWSAEVPGRLFFEDILGNVWQLDMRLEEQGPVESAPRSGPQ